MKDPLPEVTNLDQAIEYVKNMRHYCPFSWGGRFYLLQTLNGTYAYRNLYSVRRRVEADELTDYSVFILD